MIKGLRTYNKTEYKLNRVIIHKIVSFIKKDIGFSLKELEINFVSDDIMKQINSEFLGHKYSTDVITFNYSDESNNFEGEIFICPDIAKENAKKFKVKFDDEIKRLIIHGLLHLIGYDDKEKVKFKEMKLVEDYFVRKIKMTGRILK